MSPELRNCLWNVLHAYYLHDRERASYDRYAKDLEILAKRLQIHFFKLPVDDLENYASRFLERVKVWFLKAEFYQVYDLVEWIATNYSKSDYSDERERAERFCETVNSQLEQERSAYRFVSFQITPIVNSEEVEAVNQAAAPKHGAELTAAHIQAAIKLLSDRKSPDYRNCIKEAISAVEAAARFITGNEKATLGDALKTLEKVKKLHPALKDGFSKIYGYSSDADGIRHALSDMPTVTETDARFMLVSCSAFANYLIEQKPK